MTKIFVTMCRGDWERFTGPQKAAITSMLRLAKSAFLDPALAMAEKRRRLDEAEITADAQTGAADAILEKTGERHGS